MLSLENLRSESVMAGVTGIFRQETKAVTGQHAISGPTLDGEASRHC